MAQLIWTIPPDGSNATISLISGREFEQYLQAEIIGGGDPTSYSYRIVAGRLPQGLNYENTGSGEIRIHGQAESVTQATINRAVIRATYSDPYESETYFIDGTFNFLVEPDPAYPRFITPQGNIANISTGIGPTDSESNTQISVDYQESAANSNVKISLASGSLPPGLTIDYDRLSGIISSQQVNTNLEIPLQGTPYYPSGYANANSLGFYANSYIQPWEFTLEIQDSARSNTADFRINIYAREFLNASLDGGNTASPVYASLRPQIAWITADSDKSSLWPPEYYAGNTFPDDFRFGADSSSRYAPWLTTEPGSIGRSVANNFFARGLTVNSPEADAQVRYRLANANPSGTPSLLPSGMQLDPVTGFVWGRPRVISDSIFEFTVYTEDDAYSGYRGRSVTYNLSVSAQDIAGVSWLVPDYLGEINNGEASEFYVAAEAAVDRDLWYQLDSGNLPPGLVLLENGLIVGRVLFDTAGASTDYNFWITVRGTESLVYVTRRFTIRVVRANPQPYNNIYIQCYPDKSQRNIVDSILQDYSRILPQQIYRLGDPNFGLSREMRFLHALNLRVATDDDYARAMSRNHYRKRVNLGPFRSAKARNNAGELVYEVVYCEILDPLENPQGVSESSSINSRYLGETIYPNTLEAMRERLYTNIGQVTGVLPRWMSTVQDDRTILGYIPAWVVAYLLPGFGDVVAFQLNQAWGSYLPEIDFDIDRYVLDDALTYRYDPTANTWNRALNLYSPVDNISGNILTLDIDYLSTAQALKSGDIISWDEDGSNISNTAAVIVATTYSPVVGQLGDNPGLDNGNLTVTSPGAGYNPQRPPAVVFSAPDLVGGRPARGQAQVNALGQVSDITITEAGLGYHKVPTVTIDLPDDNNPTNRASAAANIRLSPVFGYSILNGGLGYSNISVPGLGNVGNVTFSISAPPQDPLNPTANIQQNTARIEGCVLGNANVGDITGLRLLANSYGQYYTTPPFVTVSPPPDLSRANTAVIRSSIRYQVLVGDSNNWQPGSNVYLFNQRAATDELDKYYLFPQVNILQ